MAFLSVDKQWELISRGTDEIIPEKELKVKLEKSRKSGHPLIVKLGCDPSRPDLHVGHGVVLRKLRHFQDLGHQAVLVIGDFTAMIGDPSGRNKTRPQLTLAEAKENAKSYIEQAEHILNIDSIKIVYNSTWLNAMLFSDVIRLSSHYTVARMLERDDFTKRYKAEIPISIHEFMYPLAQGMDSVELKADVELGGTDQKFNLLLGRKLQEQNGIKPQVCIMMPLLEGLDGIKKMSKSYDNYISISDEQNDMFGKVMSISDDLMWKYFDLLSSSSLDEIKSLKDSSDRDDMNPRDIKLKLAQELVSRFYTKSIGEECADNFINRFSRNKITIDISTKLVNKQKGINNIDIMTLLTKELRVFNSTSEVRRLINQGAIKIDKDLIQTIDHKCPNDREFLLKVGKKIAHKVTIK